MRINCSCFIMLPVRFWWVAWTESSLSVLPSRLCWLRDKNSSSFALSSAALLMVKWRWCCSCISCSGETLKNLTYFSLSPSCIHTLHKKRWWIYKKITCTWRETEGQVATGSSSSSSMMSREICLLKSAKSKSSSTSIVTETSFRFTGIEILFWQKEQSRRT